MSTKPSLRGHGTPCTCSATALIIVRPCLALVARPAAALEGFLAEAVEAVGQRDALAALRPRPARVARALAGILAGSVDAPLPAYR